jgi:hypothetical protein
MLRTHASFRGQFSKDRTGTEPPGGPIAELIRQGLEAAGSRVENGDSTDYSHTFTIVESGRCFAAMVGLVDDGDREWLFFAESTLGWLTRLLGQRDESEHLRVLRAVHGALAADHRISDLRWYSKDEWNQNPGGGAAEPDATAFKHEDTKGTKK